MADINQLSIVDLDVYGRSSQSGGGLIHKNDFAISNAIIFYLTTNKGDYLYRSDLGGILSELLFKLLDATTASRYSNIIANELQTQFGNLISDVTVSVIPNLKDRYYEIEIFYISNQTQLTNQATFYTKPRTSTDEVNFIDIYFTDDNLLAFVTLQLEAGLNKPLLLNQSDGKWYWNLYRFVNFSESSSNFEEIYSMINNP